MSASLSVRPIDQRRVDGPTIQSRGAVYYRSSYTESMACDAALVSRSYRELVGLFFIGVIDQWSVWFEPSPATGGFD